MKYNRIIYTHWNPRKTSMGYNNKKDFFESFLLSILVAKKHYSDIEIYTDDEGVLELKPLLDMNLGVKVNTKLNHLKDIKLPHYYWGYAKMYAQSLEEVPYIHIDCDVMLIDKIPEHLDKMDVIVQHPEHGFVDYLKHAEYYHKNDKTNIYGKNLSSFAYNLGVTACSNKELISEWLRRAHVYIYENTLEYHENIEEKYRHDLHNIFFEQLGFYYTLKDFGYTSTNTGMLFDSWRDALVSSTKKGRRFCHFLSFAKRTKDVVDKITNRLKSDYSKYYYKLHMKEGISIVIPSYNNVAYLKECLDSIINQDYFKNNTEWEILLGIDHCDKTLAYIKSSPYMNNPNLKIYYMDSNLGPYVVMNTMCGIVKYDNIIFFGSDDIANPDMISIIMRESKDTEIIRFRFKNFGDTNSCNDDELSMGAIRITKVLFDKTGGFRPWVCSADAEFNNRCSKNSISRKDLDSVLFLRRKHNNSLTINNYTNEDSIIRRLYHKGVNNINPELKIETIVENYTIIKQ